MRKLARHIILAIAGRSRRVRRLARFIVHHTETSPKKDTYRYLREIFIGNGHRHAVGCTTRSELVTRFELIDCKVPIASTPTDGLFLAEMLLNVDAAGAIVECGCYKGGSSAKLSILAQLLGRELMVFDSFEGLPRAEEDHLRDAHCRRNENWITDWTAGRYSARLDEVQVNVDSYGEPSVCHFVKGWFSDTLHDENLPRKVAFAFTDVDLASSAKDCFAAIWPRLADKGVFVSHDAAYIKVLQKLYSPDLWSHELVAIPPVFFGAGFGLCDESPHIGFMVKGETLSPEYLKSLTIDK